METTRQLTPGSPPPHNKPCPKCPTLNGAAPLTQRAWVEAHVAAFEFFGGVPKMLTTSRSRPGGRPYRLQRSQGTFVVSATSLSARGDAIEAGRIIIASQAL
jgi:hypothetical protein